MIVSMDKPFPLSVDVKVFFLFDKQVFLRDRSLLNLKTKAFDPLPLECYQKFSFLKLIFYLMKSRVSQISDSALLDSESFLLVFFLTGQNMEVYDFFRFEPLIQRRLQFLASRVFLRHIYFISFGIFFNFSLDRLGRFLQKYVISLNSSQVIFFYYWKSQESMKCQMGCIFYRKELMRVQLFSVLPLSIAIHLAHGSSTIRYKTDNKAFEENEIMQNAGLKPTSIILPVLSRMSFFTEHHDRKVIQLIFDCIDFGLAAATGSPVVLFRQENILEIYGRKVGAFHVCLEMGKTCILKWVDNYSLRKASEGFIFSFNFRKRVSQQACQQLKEYIPNKKYQYTEVHKQKQPENNRKEMMIDLEKSTIYIYILLNTFTYFQYYYQSRMSTKTIISGQLCQLPDSVNFQFKEEQEMHTNITINNLLNKCVNFKLKTNKPGLYLVKPMEGQIFNNSNIQINFKRKELTLENYNMILSNPGQNRQKFLIEFSCETEDGVGNPQKIGQVGYLAVNFIREVAQSTPPLPPKGLKDDKIDKPDNKVSRAESVELKRRDSNDIKKDLALKKAEYQKLILTKQNLLRKRNTNEQGNVFTLQDLFYTTIFSFLVGFILI